MLEKKLYTDQKDIKEDVATLLVNAFPEDERPPVPYFFQSLERKGNNIYTYYLNDEWGQKKKQTGHSYAFYTSCSFGMTPYFMNSVIGFFSEIEAYEWSYRSANTVK